MNDKKSTKKRKIRTGVLYSGCSIQSALGDLSSFMIQPISDKGAELTGKIISITIADRCLQLSAKELKNFKEQLLAAEQKGLKIMEKVCQDLILK